MKWGQTYKILQESVNRKAFPDRDDVLKLKKENADLKAKVATLQGVIKDALAEQAKQSQIDSVTQQEIPKG